MKNKRITGCALVVLLSVAGSTLSRGADETEAGDTKAKRQELREKIKGMSPEERRAALKEWRTEHPQAARAAGEQLRKRREALKNLSPEEREAKLKELRARTEKRAAELERKKADGTITEQEQLQLDRIKKFLNDDEGPRRDDKARIKTRPAKRKGAEKSQSKE